MALKSGSLGTLLQGVNQQPARTRLEGQVTEQINLISDASRGLTTRPSTTDISSLAGATPDMKFYDILFENTDYIIGCKDGEIRVWDLEGTAYTVTERAGASFAYVKKNMSFQVVTEGEDADKVIVLANRDTTVQKVATAEGRDWYAATFHSLNGQYLKDYQVEVTFSNGAQISALYEAPDGTSDGDPAKIASDYIIFKLEEALDAHPDKPAGTIISKRYDVCRILHPTLTMRIEVSDGDGGRILRGASDTVLSVEDLPRFAPNGMVVKVVTSSASEDDFWLKFQAKDTTVENGSAGFGKEGTWTEWYDPDDIREFDLATMPHKLVLDAGDFYLEPIEWAGRAVGDDDSAPFVSIVGKPIRDITGFEGRLALLGPDTVVMSRTNNPFDLWRETATEVVPTDPIDITSTKKDDIKLDWFVSFDRDLFIMADPGDSQFVIRGGGIEPGTVSMVLTTEFEITSGGTAPVSTGRTILLPFSTGEYSGVKEFYTDSDNAANAANSLTEGQDRYINGLITKMEVSQNFNMALFKTTKNPDTLWVYKYLWSGNEELQSAWSKWQFKDDVQGFFFKGSKVYILSSDDDGDVFLHYMDLNIPLNEYGYHAMLDREQVVTVSGAVELPFGEARFLQGIGCANPGLEVIPLSITRVSSLVHEYTFDPAVVPDGSTLYCGQTINWLLEPTEVFGKTYQGKVDTSKKITVQDYVVHVFNSGEFKAVGTSPYSDDWEYVDYVFPFDNEPLDEDRLKLMTGPVYIPWGERADWSTVRFEGSDIRPVTIHEVEWIGQILSTKGRRT